MPLQLDDVLRIEIHSVRILQITTDLEVGSHIVRLADLDAAGGEVRRRTCSYPIYDSAGNIIMPGDWPPAYPAGEQMYGLLQLAHFGRLRELPDGVGAGTVV
jgi:hypothetical protein